MTGSAPEGIKIVLDPVSDLEAAKPVYTALLGAPPQNDSSYYVGYDAAGQHIGLVPGGGPQAMTSPVAFWQVWSSSGRRAVRCISCPSWRTSSITWFVCTASETFR